MYPKLHYRIPYGSYTQVYIEQSKESDVNISRKMGEISVDPTDNTHGTYKFSS